MWKPAHRKRMKIHTSWTDKKLHSECGLHTHNKLRCKTPHRPHLWRLFGKYILILTTLLCYICAFCWSNITTFPLMGYKQCSCASVESLDPQRMNPTSMPDINKMFDNLISNGWAYEYIITAPHLLAQFWEVSWNPGCEIQTVPWYSDQDSRLS